jgi:hypothetical protein
MAYGLKYQSRIHPLKTTNTINVAIYKKDYVGSVTTLRITPGGTKVTMDPLDYFETYASTGLELGVINNLADYFELDELFTVSDFEYKVKIYDSSFTYFEGFIPCDIVEQQFLPKGKITINATNNLKRLSEFTPTMFTVPGFFSLISVVKHCLSFTGVSLPIYVNCRLFQLASAQESDVSQHTEFDFKHIHSDVFKKNDVEYNTCAQILDMILRSFTCFVYYWDGKWFIERWKDVGRPTKNYIIYNTNNTISVSTESFATIQVGKGDTKIKFIKGNQSTSYIPGAKQIKLTLKENEQINLVNYFFNGVTEDSNYDIEALIPPLREWVVDGYTNHSIADNYFGISKAIILQNVYTYAGRPTQGDSIYLAGTPPLNYNGFRSSLSGLYTKIKVKINHENDTTLTLKMKFHLSDFFKSTFTYFMGDRNTHPDDHIFFLRFYLQVLDEGTVLKHFIVFNSTSGTYELVNCTDMVKPDGTNIHPAIIEKSITWKNFTNPENFTTEILASVNLHEALVADQVRTIVVGICELGINAALIPTTDPFIALWDSIYGDITVTVNAEVQDNVNVSGINESFVNVIERDQDLYDSQNPNILNTLFFDETGENLTPQYWVDLDDPSVGDVPFPFPLPKKILQDMYQIYHVPRHKLTSDFEYLPSLKPFSIIHESHYTNDFILTGFQWDVEASQFLNTEIKEYVMDDNVTF